MSLKISLRPSERLIIGGAVVTNGNKPTDIFIDNMVPILRERDILSEEHADTPCKRIYLAVQLMYIDEKNLPAYQKIYRELANDVATAAPSTATFIEPLSENVAAGNFYQALKQARKLIDYEEELLKNAR